MILPSDTVAGLASELRGWSTPDHLSRYFVCLLFLVANPAAVGHATDPDYTKCCGRNTASMRPTLFLFPSTGSVW